MILNWSPCSRLYFLVFIVLFSCTSNEPEDFKAFDQNGYYRLISLGDENDNLKDASLFYVDILILDSAANFPDTISKGYNLRYLIGNDPLSNFLKTQNRGDSLEILYSGNNLFLPEKADSGWFSYRVRILNSLNRTEMEQAEIKERHILSDFFKSSPNAAAFTEHEGVFIRTIKEGDSTRVRPGMEITVNWEGRDFNNRVFDATERMDGPFKFVLGNSGQVIEGLEIALTEMHLGEQAEVIIPSHLAFGARGSVDNHVQPFTAVIYKIELLEIE